MNFRFSLRVLLLTFTLISIGLYLAIEFWPHPQVPGNPNVFGQLTDTQGNPLPDATVGIYDYGNSNPNARPGAPVTTVPCHETITGRNGKFLFRSIKLNHHDVLYLGMSIDRDQFDYGNVFIKIDHKTHCLVNAENRSGFRGACFQWVDLIEDLNYEFNFKMMPGGTVTGRLVTSSGRPIANSRVRFVSQKQSGYFRTYVTDDEGKFKSFALSPGNFDVELEYLDRSKFDFLKKEFPKEGDAELTAALRASELQAGYDKEIWRDHVRGGFCKFETVRINVNEEESFDVSIRMEDWLNGFQEDSENDREAVITEPFRPRGE